MGEGPRRWHLCRHLNWTRELSRSTFAGCGYANNAVTRASRTQPSEAQRRSVCLSNAPHNQSSGLLLLVTPVRTCATAEGILAPRLARLAPVVMVYNPCHHTTAYCR
eukprot:1512248-Pyramimonas_sp.AAC.2